MTGPPRNLRARLHAPDPLIAVELRPPRRDLAALSALEAWIDVYQSVRRLAGLDTVVFLTDSAVGTDEEENLAHLERNLGREAQRDRVVPFLTLKHSLEYCRRFAARAHHARFPGLVVLGGDKHDGVPRCLPHAWQLRERLRREFPGLLLGGWANPYRDAAEQVGYLADHAESLDFVLTQIVSHHDIGPLRAFLDEAARRGLDVPVLVGVFFYRSARAATLDRLARFIPVPKDALAKEFAAGARAEEIAARTLRAALEAGATRFYVSNLPVARAPGCLSRIAAAAGLPAPAPLAPPGRASYERRRR
ncbi:MAG: hypothetical protein D6718_10275 [Acidobacteria bacterium]|nr:MAG: hypothetical protein D6718_10275 [Acidobacteriota bacterium]